MWWHHGVFFRMIQSFCKLKCHKCLFISSLSPRFGGFSCVCLSFYVPLFISISSYRYWGYLFQLSHDMRWVTARRRSEWQAPHSSADRKSPGSITLQRKGWNYITAKIKGKHQCAAFRKNKNTFIVVSFFLLGLHLHRVLFSFDMIIYRHF